MYVSYYDKFILSSFLEKYLKLYYNTCMKKIIVTQKYNNKKLNTFILDTFKKLNPNILYKALRKKDIRINDKKVSENVLIHTGDEISIYIIDELLLGKKEYNLDIIYEDDNILIVNKDSGLSVTENDLNEESLTSILKEKYGNTINPCHRLDRNTKGLVLYSKNEPTLNFFLEKFKNKEIEKHYYTKVYGIIKKETDILKDYLFKDSKKNLVYISDIPKKGYLEIITEYKVLKRDLNENTTTLDITLHTGRTHQIRAHLSYIGFPIIGDGKYGKNEINKNFNLKTQYLYSYKLKFNFTTPGGVLEGINGLEVKVGKIGFVSDFDKLTEK